MPTLGFEAGGVRTETLGAARATWRVERTRVVTEWTNEQGKVTKAPPAAVAREFAVDLKDLKRDAKDAEAVLAATPMCLDALYLRDVSWSVTDWRERYVDHGLVGAIGRRLIRRGGEVSFLALDGIPKDLGGMPIALSNEARMHPWHPRRAGPRTRRSGPARLGANRYGERDSGVCDSGARDTIIPMPTTFGRPAAMLAALSCVFVCSASAAAQLGSAYCPAVANSTGAPARIVAVGSVDVSLDRLELRCEGLPAGTVGVFLYGRDEAFLPGHAGTVGTLCLAAPFTRDPLGALQATQAGGVRRALDLASVPLPGGPTSVAPGDTLRVQYWYRDTTPLGGTANSSDGVRLTFGASFPDAAEVLIATGLRPRIELGDLDGDGVLDIVAVGSEGRVTVHRSLGGRIFEERTGLALGEQASDLALGDFDGDGDVDAAITLHGSGVIALLANDGEGVLERQQDIVGLPLVRSVRSVDLDGDGALDLVVLQSGGPQVPSEVVSLRNVGALQFSVLDRHVGLSGYGIPTLALGDLDGDQDADVLFIDHRQSGPSPPTTVLLNDGLGAWSAHPGPAASGHVSNVYLADVDGDGALDALLRMVPPGSSFAERGSSELHRGDGVGGFHSPSSLLLAAVIAPAEDIDRDGDPDFVGIGITGVFTFLENRGGVLHGVEHRALIRPSNEARFADLDADGWPELVMPKVAGEAVGVRRMGPGLDIAEDEFHYTSPQPWEVGQGDLDADGDADFLAWGSSHAFVLENRGTQLAVAVPIIPMGSDVQQVLVCDVDGDQTSDFIAIQRSPHTTTIRVRRGLGGFTYAPVVPHTAVRAITRASHGDLDGDGREDLVFASDFGLAICLNDGAGGFRTPVRVGGNVLTRDVALVDLDLDGALDIVAAEGSSATVVAYHGDGAGDFGARVAVPVGMNPSGLASGDWDQDGWPDVVVRNAGDGTLQTLMNDGAGVLLASPPFAASDVTDRIGVGDLDGDGLPDLALATGDDESVVIRSGLGDGTFAQRRAYAVRRPARNVLPLDVDGDGVQELVALVSALGGFVTVLR